MERYDKAMKRIVIDWRNKRHGRVQRFNLIVFSILAFVLATATALVHSVYIGDYLFALFFGICLSAWFLIVRRQSTIGWNIDIIDHSVKLIENISEAETKG